MTDIAIIGGGPAGLAAGLYAVRGGASVRLLEEMFTGGQIVKTHCIENYPGISDGPDGYGLAARFEEHATKAGVNVEYVGVASLSLTDEKKEITLSSGETFEAKAVILCMGASPRALGIPGERELLSHGISYCATCDGAFYRGKTATVIGGGDTAISDAIYLSKLCQKVYVVHRRDSLRASAVLANAALKTENIEFVWNSVPEAFLGEGKLNAIRLRNTVTNEVTDLMTDGAFVAVGIVPKTELVEGQIKLAPNGSIETNERMETSVKGVFAAGDIRNTPLRQVVTACADGAIAATYAIEAVRV
ncbi:MAG: thioredoxin-disulfide reductase [Clostridia bacterium]|nr:thioredoxin-disulfide reductase [Clostridia bacterium]MBQ9188525.1 thioredoxin-disulfide reductase [Clostridia bacterium]